jgi:allantoate deiminase
MMPLAKAGEVIHRCRVLAACSEEPGFTTRTFLSAPMREVHDHLRGWMETAGLAVAVDDAGNLRGTYHASSPLAPRLFIGSHLDTVAHAGAFDGVLGVVLAVALVDLLAGRRLPFTIEIVGFSEEEGVRFGAPFIGSRALAGSIDDALLSRRDAGGRTVRDAIRDYGLDPAHIGAAHLPGDAAAYLEFHIEQGPVLDNLGVPLGIVDGIVGQSRLTLEFTGAANHAGTTPMGARRDALAGAAEWVGHVERLALGTPGLVATVGQIEAVPGATNVVPGFCRTSLDVRHADNAVRRDAVTSLVTEARAVAASRGLGLHAVTRLEQPTTAMSPGLVAMLERAVRRSGAPVHRLSSGAGHDAMIMAARLPAAMLFVRSPGGLSHHPDESVTQEDVAAALTAGRCFLDDMAGSASWPT